MNDFDPADALGWDKAAAQDRIEENRKRLGDLHELLWAENKRAVLIVLQGMDTSGKDGLIRKVMTAFNPQACEVWSFKVPTPEEAAHDFLWRIHRAAPRRGEVTIFNRSHYEDVLVVRVHALVPRPVWEKRYAEINAFEKHLHDHGTTVLKFYLDLSREEQRRRLLERLEQPHKHWKFSEGDLAERRRWKDYRAAYHDALARCSTDWAPWYVIPSDRKWYRDFAVAQIVCDALERMKPEPPKVKLDLKRLRAELSKD